jgi:hypothetical protein
MSDYVCANCGISGVKLWREYQTVAPQLLCATCAAEDQHKDISTMTPNGRYLSQGERGMWTDQIGWYVPAVPTEDGNYWGYTSVPDTGVDWWKCLPLGVKGGRE